MDWSKWRKRMIKTLNAAAILIFIGAALALVLAILIELGLFRLR